MVFSDPWSISSVTLMVGDIFQGCRGSCSAWLPMAADFLQRCLPFNTIGLRLLRWSWLAFETQLSWAGPCGLPPHEVALRHLVSTKVRALLNQGARRVDDDFFELTVRCDFPPMGAMSCRAFNDLLACSLPSRDDKR